MHFFRQKQKYTFILALLSTFLFVLLAQAQESPNGRPVPQDGPHAQMVESAGTITNSPRISNQKLGHSLRDLTGSQRMVVRLSHPSVGDSLIDSPSFDVGIQYAAQLAIGNQQMSVMESMVALDPNVKVLGRTSKVLNALYVDMDVAAAEALAASDDVMSIRTPNIYQMDLSETVPYIGGTAVQDMGYDGSGVTVAVLDSGVDYTHANLGGGGTLEDYEAAYGADPTDPANTTRDGLFPTSKVIGGFDFLGEEWGGSGDPITFDDDPIDFEGHGTHVADIIAGANGVAPGANILAYKVCASLTSACEGMALLLAMEAAVNDGADVINLSLGASYGNEFDDDLSAAVEAAARLNVLTVASAGNSGNNMYAIGTPAASPSAFAVAQTAVPSAILDFISIEGGGSYPAIFQDWSVPLAGAVTAPAQYGDLDGTNLDGCLPFAGDLTGYIVMVDRGACNFSTKIVNIGNAGGTIGIIGLVAAGEPFSGGFGGGDFPSVPGFMISLAAADDFRAAAEAGLSVTFDPANAASLVGTMASTSSRGPSNSWNEIKPEIGAPGASVSAIAGTGDLETAFGGTSGAAPMVSGAAALLIQHFDESGLWMRPRDIKALMMSHAETEIYTTSTELSDQLAPITRIGGGELRVDRAINATGYVYDRDQKGSGSASIWVGQVDLIRERAYRKHIAIVNHTAQERTYKLTPTFRFADKEATGAVEIHLQEYVTVAAHSEEIVVVDINIDPRLLPDWVMDIGFFGTGADALDFNEFDGYIMIDDQTTDADDEDPMHAAWSFLPRAASQVRLTTDYPEGGFALDSELGGFPTAEVPIANWGYGPAEVYAFSLLRESEDIPEGGFGEQMYTPDMRQIGYNSFGFEGCAAGWGMEFAINAWERQAHTYPGLWEIGIDTNNDGFFDHFVYNFDLFSTGQSVTVVDAYDLDTGEYIESTFFFFAISPTNYASYILTICGEQLGFVDDSPVGAPMPIIVSSFDLQGGEYRDEELNMTISPFGNRYQGLFYDAEFDAYSSVTDMEYRDRDTLTVVDFGEDMSSASDTGVMMMWFNARENKETLAIYTEGHPEDNDPYPGP